jgi:GNAT superfamily N-acetyltransferase
VNRTQVAREVQQAHALMERVLRHGRATTLAAEYPLVFDPRFGGRLVGVMEHGDVRSACATLVRELVFGGARLRVGLIGSVATEPDWRGRGLATRALDAAEAQLARDGCVAAVLWADDPSFYAKRGYREFGWEIDCLIPASALAGVASDPRARAAAPDDAAAIHRCYTRHASRVDRTPQETAALLGSPGMDTLVLQRERDVAAYACLGRGADFSGTVHEWGGETDDVLALLAEFARRARTRGHDAPLALIAPPSAAHLLEQLASLDAQFFQGVLALGKVLLADELGELLDRFAAPWRVERDSRNDARSALVLRGERGARELSGAEALTTLFPARGERGELERLERELGGSVALPQCPFLWGLDSI